WDGCRSRSGSWVRSRRGTARATPWRCAARAT
ncbi:MAG: hypothetical protein AVDCRST_MAG66-3867, partial [uncultured Pseudonocardia sp.]